MAAEKNFENQVKRFLKDQGCWILKYWGGASYTKSGVPDLLVCCNGSFVAIEVKAPNGRPSDLQIVNLRNIDKSGGYAVLLYPQHYELFKNFILCLKSDPVNAKHNYDLLKLQWISFEERMNKRG